MNRIVEANFLPPPVEEAEEKARILIIDDSRDFTYSAKRALERTRHYSVWEENDPAKAHQTAQRVKPDLIVLDIAMPEADGGEVAGPDSIGSDIAQNAESVSHGSGDESGGKTGSSHSRA